MPTVRALAADDAWCAAMAASARATVASSFDHAVNVELGGGLLAVLGAGGRPAPGALLTTAQTLPRWRAGTAVELAPSRVRIGGLEIEARGCEVYSCAVAAVEPASVAVEESAVLQALESAAVTGSFLAGPNPSPFERALGGRLRAAARAYRDVLGSVLRGWDGPGAPRGDADTGQGAATTVVGRAVGPETAAVEAVAGPEAAVGVAVAGLVGLGVGLTPSGDDYLVGSLAALWHLGAEAAAHAVGEAVRARAASTTAESRHFLRAAAQGRFHCDLARAAVACLTSAAGLTAAFRPVTAIGSTSGTDALHGLVDTALVWAGSSPHLLETGPRTSSHLLETEPRTTS